MQEYWPAPLTRGSDIRLKKVVPKIYPVTCHGLLSSFLIRGSVCTATCRSRVIITFLSSLFFFTPIGIVWHIPMGRINVFGMTECSFFLFTQR